MAWFSQKVRSEKRAKKKSEKSFSGNETAESREDFSGELLLRTLLFEPGTVTKAEALNIPSVQGCINFIANMISMLPVKLYREDNGETTEVTDDARIRLLNDDTGDTLDAVQFRRALITDYYLGKGGYAYINRRRNDVVSLHYVDEAAVSLNGSTDPIFKDYDIWVNGEAFKPFEFLKILRNTKNGASGKSIIEESPLILNVIYNSMKFENTLVKKGGNKRGFLVAEERLSPDEFQKMKKAWQKANDEGSEVFALNKGVSFHETSASSLEMQMNENKEANAAEICKLFNLSADVINGRASEEAYINSFKTGVMPVLKVIESALNRDLLLEKEKLSYYWAFDTKEILKGDIKSRFEAYKTGIDANFLRIDEVRFMEDLPSLGLDWIKIGLDSVLYNPQTKEIYTPNTNKLSDMKGGKIYESGSQG